MREVKIDILNVEDQVNSKLYTVHAWEFPNEGNTYFVTLVFSGKSYFPVYSVPSGRSFTDGQFSAQVQRY